MRYIKILVKVHKRLFTEVYYVLV